MQQKMMIPSRSSRSSSCSIMALWFVLLLGGTTPIIAFSATPPQPQAQQPTRRSFTTTTTTTTPSMVVVRPMPTVLHASIASTISNDSNNNNKKNLELMTTTSSRRSSSSSQLHSNTGRAISSTTVPLHSPNHHSSNNNNPPPLKRHAARKICLMVEPTPFTHVSGYANRFQEMLKFLRKAGDDVHILTVDSKTPASQLPKEYMGYPIEHTQGFTFPLYNHISLTIDLPEMKGGHILEQMKPDIIHVTSPGFLLFAAMFYARVMKIPLVMSYHTHLPSYGKNYLGFIPRVEKICWELLRYAHSRADLTLVTSPQMQQELQANGIPRVEVWRKGIDTERFHPSFYNNTMRERMTNNNPNDYLLVYIGRLGAEKRLKDIRAVLQKMPANTRLCIVGAGPQKEELEEWFANEKVVFTGQLSGDDLSAAFASADVFVMPSDSETLGFVVLESMASGVPVVGAAAGGILDLIDDGKTSFLVEPGNTDRYVQRLNELRESKFRSKMGKAARNEAERWGWEAATSQLRNVQYEKALINFHSRAFGGFGRPGTATMWRLLEWRIRSTIRLVSSYILNGAIIHRLWKKLSIVQKYIWVPRWLSWNQTSTGSTNTGSAV